MKHKDCEHSGAHERTAEAVNRFREAVRHNPYQGAMAAIYAEGKALEFIAAVFATMGCGAEPVPTDQPDDHRSALAARDILKENLANPPPIAELAQRVGLSQRRLNSAFHALFGASPFQCLTEWRLDQARHLLETTDLSVKKVAYSMGYTHLSSFSHAYLRRFGVRPSRRELVPVPGSPALCVEKLITPEPAPSEDPM